MRLLEGLNKFPILRIRFQFFSGLERREEKGALILWLRRNVSGHVLECAWIFSLFWVWSSQSTFIDHRESELSTTTTYRDVVSVSAYDR